MGVVTSPAGVDIANGSIEQVIGSVAKKGRMLEDSEVERMLSDFQKEKGWETTARILLHHYYRGTSNGAEAERYWTAACMFVDRKMEELRNGKNPFEEKDIKDFLKMHLSGLMINRRERWYTPHLHEADPTIMGCFYD